MLVVLILCGLKFIIFTDKGQEQPLHIHVHHESEGGKARIDIETGEVVENLGLKQEDLQKAVDAVVEYRSDFLKAWDEYFGE